MLPLSSVCPARYVFHVLSSPARWQRVVLVMWWRTVLDGGRMWCVLLLLTPRSGGRWVNDSAGATAGK